jgi:phosphoserine phosphatase RsbU/P
MEGAARLAQNNLCSIYVRESTVTDGKIQSILIVDDTEANVDILVEMLGDDFDVSVAMDGSSALEQVAAEAPDLVLLDIMMPGISGIEVLERMKKDELLRHIPIIMISALGEIETVVHCIERGAEDYLSKPFDPVLLRARINASLDKKRFHDAEKQYLDTIVKTQAELHKEISEAADYVRSLLPEPLSGPITAAWRFIPSTQLGGDTFGYHWIDDDHFVIYLIDVCGHGVGAALLSITIMNLIRSGSLPTTDFHNPGAVLKGLNERFQMDTQHDKYFTIWYGVYHVSARQLFFSSAGHPPAVLLSGPSPGEMKVRKLKGLGIPIGWDPDSDYEVTSCPCDSCARLYIFSDGTYEIKKLDGASFTHDEFTQLIAAAPEAGSSQLERIVSHIRTSQGSDYFDDDFSLLEITLP